MQGRLVCTQGLEETMVFRTIDLFTALLTNLTKSEAQSSKFGLRYVRTCRKAFCGCWWPAATPLMVVLWRSHFAVAAPNPLPKNGMSLADNHSAFWVVLRVFPVAVRARWNLGGPRAIRCHVSAAQRRRGFLRHWTQPKKRSRGACPQNVRSDSMREKETDSPESYARVRDRMLSLQVYLTNFLSNI